MGCKRKRQGYYVVTRVTTVTETCHVNAPTKKLAERWAKSSDAIRRVEHNPGWEAQQFVVH